MLRKRGIRVSIRVGRYVCLALAAFLFIVLFIFCPIQSSYITFNKKHHFYYCCPLFVYRVQKWHLKSVFMTRWCGYQKI